jgi:hypothetical protein
VPLPKIEKNAFFSIFGTKQIDLFQFLAPKSLPVALLLQKNEKSPFFHFR